MNTKPQQLRLISDEALPSRFADNYLRREHKTLLTRPDHALTELVANAWDAGAALVEISIPKQTGERLSVSDDGTGMTAEEFAAIWPTLRYDRVSAKGRQVAFPPGSTRTPRICYGSNGIGRHAILCFASSYTVTTTKSGSRNTFEVHETSGDSAIKIQHISAHPDPGHGTTISCNVEMNLPSPDEMLDLLSARFAHDPEFVLRVNGVAARLDDHSSLVVNTTFTYGPGHVAELLVLDTQKTARTTGQHGVTFWVGARRVGAGGWDLIQLDGRLREARRMIFIVRTRIEDLQSEVREDWTGFKSSDLVRSLHDATQERVLAILTDIFAARTRERTEEVISARKTAISELDPLAQLEVAELARDVAANQPLATTELLTAAVDALIRIENSRSGQALLQKLAKLSPEDVEALNQLLDEWTVKDALTVLGELGRRLRIVEAISRLSSDPLVDELHTLHPLVTHARWLFGVEFDTPAYISNVSLNTALRKITGKTISDPTFNRRPDLLVLDDGVLGATAIDDVSDGGIASLRAILLIELKKGGSTIGRKELEQATGYAEDLIASKDIDGSPMVYGFVVGHNVDSARISDRRLERDSMTRGCVRACSYNQLTRTADARLHHLRGRLDHRFPPGIDHDLLRAVLAQGSLV